MTLFFNYVVDGIQSGTVYAALALAIVLIWRAAALINFAQGEMAMFATFITWGLYTAGIPIVPAVIISMAIAFAMGAAIERTMVRSVERSSHLGAVTLTLGLSLALNGLAEWIWGTNAKSLPNIFPGGSFHISGVVVQDSTVGMLLLLLVVTFVLYLIFQRTRLGLTLRAVADNSQSAQLCGVHIGRTRMIGWGMSAAIGALAAALIVPVVGQFDANFMDSILVLAFAAATFGGFDSPLGAIVGGLVVGVIGSLTAGYISPDFQLTSAFVVLFVVLLIKPNGLFGARRVQRV